MMRPRQANEPLPEHWSKRLETEARLLGDARMLRDDQELTPELTTAIITRFRELLARLGKSEGWAARSLSIKPSTLSQVLSGNYAGDTESRIRQIDKWTEIQLARESAPKDDRFVKTTTALEIIGVAKMAMRHNEPGIYIVHGPSGIGKTMTAQFLRGEIPGSVLMRISTAGMSKLAVYDTLAKQLRLTGLKLTSYQLQEQLVTLLKDSGRLIIVDEVHKLCGRQKDEGLHALRDLHDLTGCPMLWIGTADIANYIETARNDRDSVEQIYGRVKWWLDLTYAASRSDGGPGLHNVDDIRKVLAGMQVRATGEAEQYLKELSNKPKMGGLRTVAILVGLLMSKPGADGRAITLEMLEDLQRERLGVRAAGQLEKDMSLRMTSRVAAAG